MMMRQFATILPLLCALVLAPAAVRGQISSEGSRAAPAPLATPFDIRGAERVRAPAAPDAPAPAPVAAESAPQVSGDIGRYLLPTGNLRLAGERSSRAWNVFLTQEQVESARDLRLTYINAVAVMPEISRLQVSINDRVLVLTPIASPSAPRTMDVRIPEGVLRAGANVVRIEAEQRHRVVCTVAATYELWTDIIAARTGLTFAEGSRPRRLQSLDDLPAVGVGDTGRTTLSVVVAGAFDTVREQQVLQLSQALALRGRFFHAVVALPQGLPQGSREGELVVVLGQDQNLPRELTANDLPGQVRPGIAFAPLADQSTALVISGATREDVERNIDSIVPRMAGDRTSRPDIDNSPLFHPETPFVTEGVTIPFSMLGVENQQFSGRRFTISMSVGLPADFYAEAYGEAQFLLDTGFATALLPESNFTVTVNGNTTAVQPIEVKAGDMQNRLPIRIPMRHFRPGVNIIGLEGTFRTEADEICAPGTTLSDEPRFAIFDTSKLVIPEFGRAGRSPDLAAFSARGFPYWQSARSLPVFLADRQRETLAAAATLVARLAFNAQRIVTIEIAPSLNSIRQQGALIVGAAEQLPLAVFSQVGLAQDLRAVWAQSAPGQQARTDMTRADMGAIDYDSVAERFRQRQGRGQADLRETWLGRTGDSDGPGYDPSEHGLRGWIKDTFDLSVDTLLPSWKNGPYTPAGSTSLLLAQGNSPDGDESWTLMTSGTPAMLESAIARLTQPDLWAQIAGRITVFRMSSDTVTTIMPERTRIVQTRETDIFNLRRVIANWLSENMLIYALALIGASLLLGAGAFALLTHSGRR